MAVTNKLFKSLVFKDKVSIEKVTNSTSDLNNTSSSPGVIILVKYVELDSFFSLPFEFDMPYFGLN